VRSPEQVALELPVAGPTSRILAYAIDGLLMLVLAIGVIVLLIWALPVAEWLVELLDRAADELVGDETQDPGLGGAGLLLLAIYIGIQLVVEIFYFVFFVVLWRGASPGKRALGLAVVGENGLPVSFTASLVRNLLRAVDALPVSYLTGLVTMLVSEHTRRLGDIAAGTIVIRFDRPPRSGVGSDSHDSMSFLSSRRSSVAYTAPRDTALGAISRPISAWIVTP
jgi:uncharacterized RDD family membrane protein YckC